MVNPAARLRSVRGRFVKKKHVPTAEGRQSTQAMAIQQRTIAELQSQLENIKAGEHALVVAKQKAEMRLANKVLVAKRLADLNRKLRTLVVSLVRKSRQLQQERKARGRPSGHLKPISLTEAATDRQFKYAAEEIDRLLAPRFESDGKSLHEALCFYVSRKVDLLRCAARMNPEFLLELRKEVIAAIETHWDPTRACAVKVRGRLSDVKYTSLSHTLSFQHDGERWVLVELWPGVPMPRLPPLQRVKSRFQQIVNVYGNAESDDGKVVSVDLKVAMRQILVHVKRDGESHVTFQILLDAASLFRRVKQVTVGIRALAKWQKHNAGDHSPFNITSALVWQGADNNYAVLKQRLAPLVEVKEQVKKEGLQLDADTEPHHVTIDFAGGGDAVAVTAAQGLSGPSSLHPCPLCMTAKKDFGCTGKVHTPRTLLGMQQMAHSYCPDPWTNWTCPACKVTFTSKKDLLASAPTSDKARTDHAQKHFGQKHGCEPLLKEEPENIVPCTLHLLLNVVMTLIARRYRHAPLDAGR
eukprot:jgi/Mesvir1/5223/Mv15352-RA.1